MRTVDYNICSHRPWNYSWQGAGLLADSSYSFSKSKRLQDIGMNLMDYLNIQMNTLYYKLLYVFSHT